MTIAASTRRNFHVGNNTTDTYSFTFPIVDQSELRVVRVVRSTGVKTLLTLTTDYTVDGVGDSAGGTITLVAGNLASSLDLLILGNSAFEQDTSIRNQGAFHQEVHEDAFDKLTVLTQQLSERSGRAIKIDEIEDVSSFETQLKIGTAGQVLAINESENGLRFIDPQSGTPGDDGVGVPVGGTAGQVLAKIDGTNYNTEWVDPATGSGVPNGGTTGQVLKKQSNADGDADWEDESGGGPADTDALSEGSTNLYFTEARVLGTDLAGYTSGAGTVAATDTILQAIQKLNGNGAAHLADSTDAHAASAITNTPSGNLAATEVQSALNELQTDIDGRQLRSTLTTKGDIYVATGSGTTTRLAAGTDGYALVTDSAQATGLKYVATSFTAPNSSVIFNTGVTSNGSTNTTVRRFTNVSTAGTALTANQSTTNGDSVTVNEAGTYTISYTDVATAINSNYAAITINGSALTTDPASLTYAQGFRAGSYNASDEMWFVGSVTLILAVNDVIRFQRTNARLSSSSRVVAVVTQVTK